MTSRSTRRSYLYIRSIGATLSFAVLSACGGSSDHQLAADPSLDLDSKALTAQGCLNLADAFAQFARVSPATKIRHHTTDFKVEWNEHMASRASWAALTAKGKFKYKEQAIKDFIEQEPKMTQTACESLTMDFGELLGGTQTLKVVAAENPNQLKLVKADNSQIVYELKGPRELQVSFYEKLQDTCPNRPTFPTHLGKTTESLTWGTEAELSSKPSAISKEYLKMMRGAVSQMPRGLLSLLAYEEGEFVQANATDLQELFKAPVPAAVADCGYRGGGAPSGDEPVFEDPTPTPTPAPTPEPTPHEIPPVP